MANNVESNFARKLKEEFLPSFEAQRVLTKTINTQLFQGDFNPSSGESVDVKRPHQYLAVETAKGDITSETENNITSGKATATVQNYITVDIPWSEFDQALKLNQLKEILDPATEELVTRLETNMYNFMVQQSGLSVGTPGTVVDAWGDVAAANTLMKSLGVPAGMKYYAMNDATVENLALAQSALTPDGNGTLVKTAWEMSQISTPFAGLQGIASNSLGIYTAGGTTDRAGALAATPVATYLAAKDTMTQTLSLTGLTASVTGAILAGDILEFTGTGALARSYIHQRTRVPIFGSDGAAVKWRCTATTDMDTDGSGEGSLVVTGAAISETDGQYDTISTPLLSGDVFTILGAKDVVYQPNLFYHKDAFVMATVKLEKLQSTDTVITNRDGISVRVSKYSDVKANTQAARFDILPAFGVMTPFAGGKGFGK